MADDPTHRHGFDRESLMDWRKALPPRPGPERCANLGPASTRELLEELLARGSDASFRPSTDSEARVANGAERLALDALRLLRELPVALLDYRTVEGT